jgi:uncharacterized protein YabE (DUF348 family)
MKKKISILLLFFAIIAISHFFWPFGKRNFDVKKPFTVSITDNGNYFATSASAATVSDFIAEKKIALDDKDYIFPAPEAKIFPGSRIVIRRAMPVAIEVDGKNIDIDTLGTSVGDAISEAQVALSHADKVFPDKTSLLSPNLTIKITRINFEEVANEEDIPFQTVEKEDSAVLWRKKAVKQQGETGTREKTYKVTYTNGKETNRVLLGTKITKQPVSQINVVGTKIIVGKTQSGDATWYVNGDDLTCASLTFAQGKYLRVTNRSNGKSVIVQVNDSGPYGKGRVIDLNKKAFQKIGDIGAGVINVKVEEILN